jgi:hypothetical protein
MGGAGFHHRNGVVNRPLYIGVRARRLVRRRGGRSSIGTGHAFITESQSSFFAARTADNFFGTLGRHFLSDVAFIGVRRDHR